MLKGPGFPDPLFEDISELDEVAEKYGHSSEICIPIFLMDGVHIGGLRVADQILGDLTIKARESVNEMIERIAELRLGVQEEDEDKPIASPSLGGHHDARTEDAAHE